MNLYVDSSAIVAFVASSQAREFVLQQLELNKPWFSSEISKSESISTIRRVFNDASQRSLVEDDLSLFLDRFYLVPVDESCLANAGQLMSISPLGLSRAIHLASARRVPEPKAILTLDSTQVLHALNSGLQVLSPESLD